MSENLTYTQQLSNEIQNYIYNLKVSPKVLTNVKTDPAQPATGRKGVGRVGVGLARSPLLSVVPHWFSLLRPSPLEDVFTAAPKPKT